MTLCRPFSRGLPVASLLVLFSWSAVPAFAGQANEPPFDLTDEQCMKCHGDAAIAETEPRKLLAMVRAAPDTELVPRSPDEILTLFISPHFKSPPHENVRCVECHRGVERLPHVQRLSPVDCDLCHEEARQTLALSSHRPGTTPDGRRRPGCVDCHGPPHEIQWRTRERDFATAVGSVFSCVQCHEEETAGGISSEKTYRENVHGRALFDKGLSMSALCTDCHGYHDVLPPEDLESPLHPLNVLDTCGRCHEGIKDVLLGSVHGDQLKAGNAEAATCTSCHSSHGIKEVAEPFLLGMIEECSSCHEQLGASYLTSYHGKAAHLGSYAVAVCSSCHGHHDVLPVSDPGSRVHAENLVETCSTCHENANPRFASYISHIDGNNRKDYPQVYYVWLFMELLLLGVMAFFIPHSLLWFQRSLGARLKRPRGDFLTVHAEPTYRRFTWYHRLTHGLMALSFVGLVATGFPLKYSNAEWALTISNAFGGVGVMGTLHRFCAVITFIYAAMHLGYLAYFFAFRCPRPLHKFFFGPNSLLPNWRDLRQIIHMFRWFLWMGPRPHFGRWSYFEKFDYWGAFWGIAIIGGSGVVLWIPDVFTAWLPGWVINSAMIVHSGEALLAAAFIFMIHFFNTHLRPRKFPIDLVMLTGQVTETEMQDERPAELEELRASGELEKLVVSPVRLGWRVVASIVGIAVFLCGIALIVLGLITELRGLLS